MLHAGTGQQQTLDERFYQILSAFRIASSCQTAYQALGEADFGFEQMQRAVDILVEQGWLEVEHPGAGFEPGRRGLFASPLLALEQVLADPSITDVVLGLAYDLGCSNRSGSRLAPDFLRLASPQLFGRAGSDFDPVKGGRVLAGRRLADLGNLAGAVFQSNGECFERLARVVELLLAQGRRPVLLGGDHSITYAGLQGMMARGPVQLVQFDAHSDYAGPVEGDWRDRLHHGNFVSWALEHERLERVVQVGVRQLVSDDEQHPRIVRFAGLSALDSDWLSCLSSSPIYLTIDVDCLEPSLFPSTGTPVPGGFTPRELVRLVEQLVRSSCPAVIDLVELLPDREVDALIACEVMLRALDS